MAVSGSLEPLPSQRFAQNVILRTGIKKLNGKRQAMRKLKKIEVEFKLQFPSRYFFGTHPNVVTAKTILLDTQT